MGGNAPRQPSGGREVNAIGANKARRKSPNRVDVFGKQSVHVRAASPRRQPTRNEMPDVNQHRRDPAEQIKDYFRGMKRVQAEHLPRLAEYDDWSRLARREIEKRATRIVEMFDDELLAAIADGSLDVTAAIREVMREER
jgi:catalase